MGRTTFNDGTYIEFQKALIGQAPRPEELDKKRLSIGPKIKTS